MMAVLSKTRTSLPPGRPFSNLIKHEERAMTFIQKKRSSLIEKPSERGRGKVSKGEEFALIISLNRTPSSF